MFILKRTSALESPSRSSRIQMQSGPRPRTASPRGGSPELADSSISRQSVSHPPSTICMHHSPFPQIPAHYLPLPLPRLPKFLKYLSNPPSPRETEASVGPVRDCGTESYAPYIEQARSHRREANLAASWYVVSTQLQGARLWSEELRLVVGGCLRGARTFSASKGAELHHLAVA